MVGENAGKSVTPRQVFGVRGESFVERPSGTPTQIVWISF
jgi:hypothetical protein